MSFLKNCLAQKHTSLANWTVNLIRFTGWENFWGTSRSPVATYCHQRLNVWPSCEELTPWKRLWCWEGLGAGGEGDDRGWDGSMASLTRWTWVWVNSGSWWWTGRPGVLRFMGSQRVRHDWATELNLPNFSNFASSYGILKAKIEMKAGTLTDTCTLKFIADKK